MLACIPLAHPCCGVIFSPAPGVSSTRPEGKGAERSGPLVPRRPQGEIQLGNLHSFTCKVNSREGALGFQGTGEDNGQEGRGFLKSRTEGSSSLTQDL